MKLYQQQDDKGQRRRPKTAKLFRQFKHREERRRAKADPECAPYYRRYAGYVL